MIAMREQVLSRISTGLIPALRPTAGSSETGSQPKSEEGYDLFLRSAAVPHDPLPNKEAIKILERAVGLDPSYAPAWDALGQRYYYDAAYSDGGQAAFDRSSAAFERAKALDPNLISAALNLSVNWVERGRLEEAYAEVAQLLKRRPENGPAHFALGYVLRYAGLLKESQHECDTALGLDPGNYTFRSCAVAFVQDGNYPRGMEYLALDAGSHWSKRNEVFILLRRGRNAAALEKVRTINDDPRMRLVEGCLEKRPSSEIAELSDGAHGFSLSDPEIREGTAEIEAFCGRNQVALGCSVKQCKIDSARILLSIPIRCFRHCAIPPSSKKSVPQQWIAKRSSWLTGASILSEFFSTTESTPTPAQDNPRLSKPTRSKRSCNEADISVFRSEEG